MALFVLSSSCGAPGEPAPLHARVPAAVADLVVRQAGEAVVLTFTPPGSTLEGDPLEGSPEVEIARGFAAADAKLPSLPPSLRVVYTIPAAVLDTYLVQDRFEFTDPVTPAEISSHAGQRLVYVVRTRISRRRASPNSNAASVILYPVPERIGELRATVVEAGVRLAWSAPERASDGQPLATLAGYRIYRAEVESGATDAATATRKSAPALVGVTASPPYTDTGIEWGHSYVYTVRSEAQYPTDSVESADSTAVLVTPRHVFSPAPPRDLVAVYVPAAGDAPAAVDLSWAINTESDLAGYNIYRSEDGGVRTRLNQDLLPVPAFRDRNVMAGGHFSYTVTAVDRAGNESTPGVAVTIAIPNSGP